jgi:hypothetical protein
MQNELFFILKRWLQFGIVLHHDHLLYFTPARHYMFKHYKSYLKLYDFIIGTNDFYFSEVMQLHLMAECDTCIHNL